MTTELELVERDIEIYADIARRFDAHNKVHTNWAWGTFSIVRRDGDKVVASARGVTNMGLVELRGVWIDPAWRGNGLGRELVTAVEAEAYDRGCRAASLDTYSWQALEFYLKLGYREFGRLPYPNGTERIYLRKDLLQRNVKK